MSDVMPSDSDCPALTQLYPPGYTLLDFVRGERPTLFRRSARGTPMPDVQELLKKTLAKAASDIEKHTGTGLNEQDTKHALIAPILEALGWSMSNLDMVRAEYRCTSKDNPVDYALFSDRRPVLYVEAKALDVAIDDHKVLTQVISYANASTVGWALLTNGRAWALYNVFEKVQPQQRCLFSVQVTDPMAAGWLQWIMPERLAGPDLDNMWHHCIAERRIQDALSRMITERDADLVALLTGRSGLNKGDVTAGLQHLRVSSAEPEFGAPPKGPTAGADTGEMKAKQKEQKEKKEEKAKQPPDHAVSISVLPGPGRKPTSFRICDRTWTVTAWRELQVNACKYLAEVHPKQFQKALDGTEFHGKKYRFLSSSKDAVNAPVAVPGGFVEVSLSADDCVRLTRRLLKFCAVELSESWYEAEASPT